MNKKQLIVGWGMGIIISFAWLVWSQAPHYRGNSKTEYLIAIHTITFIIGGLLIYTLRDKKE